MIKDLGLRQAVVAMGLGMLFPPRSQLPRLCPIKQLGLPFIFPLLNQGYYTSDSATELYSGLGKRVWICRMDHNMNWLGPHPSLTWNTGHCTSDLQWIYQISSSDHLESQDREEEVSVHIIQISRVSTFLSTDIHRVSWLRAYALEGFPVGSVVKNLHANSGFGFDPWVGKILWRIKWQSTTIFLPGKSHGQRSLVGYSPLGCKSWTQLGD